MDFWTERSLNIRRVVEFLALTKADVAKISGVAPASVRFDEKSPREMRERFSEIAVTCTGVAQFFAGDVTRTELWFALPNPLLGNLSPRDMIRAGRFDRLRHFIMDALNENLERQGSVKPKPGPSESESERDFLKTHQPALAHLCLRYGVRRLSAFGSVTRADFDRTRSDIDLAVEFSASTEFSPARQYFDFKADLEQLLGRPVDLVELTAMPDSRLKRVIERTQVPLYAEAA